MSSRDIGKNPDEMDIPAGFNSETLTEGLKPMRGLVFATTVLLAAAMAPTQAAVIQDLGVNPSSTQGDFSNGVDGTTFTDQYTFQLVGAPSFITFASATNSFAKATDFISNFTGQLFRVVGAVGGGDDIPVN